MFNILFFKIPQPDTSTGGPDSNYGHGHGLRFKNESLPNVT